MKRSPESIRKAKITFARNKAAKLAAAGVAAEGAPGIEIEVRKVREPRDMKPAPDGSKPLRMLIDEAYAALDALLKRL